MKKTLFTPCHTYCILLLSKEYEMRLDVEQLSMLGSELEQAQLRQDRYDDETVCLIAPASPTKPKYCDDITLKHNPIAEGLLGHRPYAGAEHLNTIEQVAVDAAKSLFGAEHANVQPHSVSDANAAAYFATLDLGDPVLAMRFDAGGHLTHGMRKNYSGRLYDFSFYGLGDDGYIDYDEVEQLAKELRPKMIVCGASSYPRDIDFERLGDISKEVDAKLLADVSHPAGLIAAGRFPQPFPHCDIVTLTPDKTMLGAHGGLILSKEELADRIDSAVHPGVQSSIPFRRIAALAHCLIDSHGEEFNGYIDRVLSNMDIFTAVIEQAKSRQAMVTGGSSTHLMVLETLGSFGITGKDAEAALENANILTNRQVVPNDTQKPYVASGVRLGTSWITGRGYEPDEVSTIAESVVGILERPDDAQYQAAVIDRMSEITSTPHELDVWREV